MKSTYLQILNSGLILIIVCILIFNSIKEDDNEISRSAHRHGLHPDMDISAEDAEVQAVANAVWTDSVKAAWKTFKENSDL